MSLDPDSLSQIKAHVTELKDKGLTTYAIRQRLEDAGCANEDIDLLCPAEAKVVAPMANQLERQSLADAVQDLFDLLDPAGDGTDQGLLQLAHGPLYKKSLMTNDIHMHILKIREAL